MSEMVFTVTILLIGIFAGVGISEAVDQYQLNGCAAKFNVHACVMVVRPAEARG